MLDLDDLLKPNIQILDGPRDHSVRATKRHSQDTEASVLFDKDSMKKRRFHSYLLALVGIIAAVIATQIWNANNTRTTVVVAANDLAPGEVITASDIKTIDADSFSSMFEDRSNVIGRRVRVSVQADEPILESDLGEGIELPEGLVVSGLSIRPGAYPAVDLVPGDRVDVTGVNPVTGVAELIANDVQIFSVGTSGFGTDELFISLAVSPAQSLRIANSVNQAEGVRIALRAQSDS